MSNTLEIAWLAGLLEGEGCFSYQCSPGIRIGLTDKDIVERVANNLGHHIRGPYKYRINNKPVYYTEIWGSAAIGWMMTLYDFLGERRKQKIKEIIARWKIAKTKAHRLGTARNISCSHLGKRHYAHGLCRNCYQKQWRNLPFLT